MPMFANPTSSFSPGVPPVADLTREQYGRAWWHARAVAAEKMLREGAEIASQYFDTGRGDLDGWIESVRAALADAGQEGKPVTQAVPKGGVSHERGVVSGS
jgi:hypothetical protein